MELIVNGDVHEGPLSDEVIDRAIRSLTTDGDAFAILAKGEMSYIQTAGSPSSGFLLEYQDGSIEEHYSCASPGLNTEQVVRVFQRYFAGDSRWRTDTTWVKEDLGSSSKSVGTRTVLITGSIVALLILGWFVYVA